MKKIHTLKECNGTHCKCMGNGCSNYHYADCESCPINQSKVKLTTPERSVEEIVEEFRRKLVITKTDKTFLTLDESDIEADSFWEIINGDMLELEEKATNWLTKTLEAERQRREEINSRWAIFENMNTVGDTVTYKGNVFTLTQPKNQN